MTTLQERLRGWAAAGSFRNVRMASEYGIEVPRSLLREAADALDRYEAELLTRDVTNIACEAAAPQQKEVRDDASTHRPGDGSAVRSAVPGAAHPSNADERDA